MVVEQLGSQLTDGQAWWEMLTASALTAPLEALTKPDIARFKAEHLHEVGLLGTPAGIWLDLPVASVTGIK